MQKVFYLLRTCLICFFIFLFFSNCNTAVSYKSPAGYNFTKPEKFLLTAALNEISGIAFLNGNTDTLFAIEDEDGKLYTYSLSSKKLEHNKFGKKGDYEDVTIINNKEVAVLKSNGSIYLFPVEMIGKERIDSVEEYNAILPEGEYEGLFADKDTLFTLCKHCPVDKPSKEVTVYTLVKTLGAPLSVSNSFTINVSKIQSQKGAEKIKFHPSGLAKNPITNEWYIISSVNKLLLVLDEQWKMKGVYPLDPALFNQPEGIAFNSKGDLYISNEGGEGTATILLFRYQNQ